MSGGIDSVTQLAMLAKKKKRIVAVYFDYGQDNLEPTYKSAQHFCNVYGAELIKLELPYNWSKSSTINNQYVDENITDNNVYKVDVKALSWVPARNATMLLLAGGIASERGIEKVYMSFQFDKVEWDVYNSLKNKWEFAAADLTPAFISHMNKISKYCYKSPVKFIAPFITKKLDCDDIVRIGKSLNIDYDKTYSCRYCIDGHECGKCEQCIIRKKRLQAV